MIGKQLGPGFIVITLGSFDVEIPREAKMIRRYGDFVLLNLCDFSQSEDPTDWIPRSFDVG